MTSSQTTADDGPPSQQGPGARSSSYLQIMWSTVLIGGSSILNVAFSVVRNKAIAVVLGPEGIGLMGLYSLVADLAQTVAGLGIKASGVRQVAEAVGTEEAERIARIGTVLKRLSIVLGLLGALVLDRAVAAGRDHDVRRQRPCRRRRIAVGRRVLPHRVGGTDGADPGAEAHHLPCPRHHIRRTVEHGDRRTYRRILRHGRRRPGADRDGVRRHSSFPGGMPGRSMSSPSTCRYGRCARKRPRCSSSASPSWPARSSPSARPMPSASSS